jgi:hypothetical protein
MCFCNSDGERKRSRARGRELLVQHWIGWMVHRGEVGRITCKYLSVYMEGHDMVGRRKRPRVWIIERMKSSGIYSDEYKHYSA